MKIKQLYGGLISGAILEVTWIKHRDFGIKGGDTGNDDSPT